MSRLFRLALPLTVLLCLAPSLSETLASRDSRQGSQQEWISSKANNKRGSKNKKRNKKTHHHHTAFAAQAAASLNA